MDNQWSVRSTTVARDPGDCVPERSSGVSEPSDHA